MTLVLQVKPTHLAEPRRRVTEPESLLELYFEILPPMPHSCSRTRHATDAVERAHDSVRRSLKTRCEDMHIFHD